MLSPAWVGAPPPALGLPQNVPSDLERLNPQRRRRPSGSRILLIPDLTPECPSQNAPIVIWSNHPQAWCGITNLPLKLNDDAHCCLFLAEFVVQTAKPIVPLQPLLAVT